MSSPYSKQITAESLATVVTRQKRNKGGPFTLTSAVSGVGYTFIIDRTPYSNTWFTHIHVEMALGHFLYLGTYFKGAIKRYGSSNNTDAAIAICYVLKKIEENKFNLLSEQLIIKHLGKCLVCGKPLTEASSVETGMGPICIL